MVENEDKQLQVSEETFSEESVQEAQEASGESEAAEAKAIDEALEETSRLQEELSHFRELYLRKLADFENFRRRKEREMEAFRQAAHADLLRDVLPVIDNLERAVATPEGDGSGIRAGVELVLRQLKSTLARYGLVELNPIDQPFDPRFHEALARKEREDLTSEQILEVMQKGYLLHEKLLRPALVVVGVPGRSEDEVIVVDEESNDPGES